MAAIQNDIPEFGLGDRLRKAREFRGIKTVEAMAAQLTAQGRKTSASSVSTWENGDSQPRRLQDLVRLWASITEIPEAWFWGISGVSTQDKTTDTWMLSSEAA